MTTISFSALARPRPASGDARVGPTRCPWCHDDVDVAAMRWVACATCLARHHPACWWDGAACASCGATAFARAPRVEDAAGALRGAPPGRAPPDRSRPPRRVRAWVCAVGLTVGLTITAAAAGAALTGWPTAGPARLAGPRSVVGASVAAALRQPSSTARAASLEALARSPWLTPAERALVVDGAVDVQPRERPDVLLAVIDGGAADESLQRRLVAQALDLADPLQQARVLVALLRRGPLAEGPAQALATDLDRIGDAAARRSVFEALLRAQGG